MKISTEMNKKLSICNMTPRTSKAIRSSPYSKTVLWIRIWSDPDMFFPNPTILI
jgi:hypothetical protein